MENRDTSFLEKLSQKIAPASREFNMNADKVGLASSRVADPYQSGISPEDVYKLQLANQAAQANYTRDVNAISTLPVQNGTIDPRYWDAAQKASNYELHGLAGRGF